MGAKKDKEVIDNQNYWKINIEETRLDDELWKVKVVIIEAAGSDQDRIYLEKFETYAAQGTRFVIKNICKTETIFMVNQLGSDKKGKDENLRVFEEGQAYLKEKEDIPPDILALIIKHLIIQMKIEYLFIKQQKLKVIKGVKRESTTMFDSTEVRGTVNMKSVEPQEVTPPPKGKKGRVEATPIQINEDNKKYSTFLRVRGEEWRDKVYIDDYPKDGPNLYVAVTGFVEPNLAGCLIKIGVPLTAVVQIRIDPTRTTVPSSLIRGMKRGQSETGLLTDKSLKYWEDLQMLRLKKDTADIFLNTAFVLFSPPYWNTDSLSGSSVKIYNEVCYLMYDLQDLSRQQFHYLENMDVTNIPKDHKNSLYLHIYDKHIDGVPFESITSYLILDSVLQTVSECLYFGEKSRTLSISTAITGKKEVDKLQQSEILVKQVINELCHTDTRIKKYRFTYGDEYESYDNPIVVFYGDFCKYNTFHLGNINLDNIVRTMLLDMPINKFWINRNKPTQEIEAKINFHVNMLLSCFDRTDVESAELNRLIHILACRKIYNNRSSLKKEQLLPLSILEFKKKYLKRSVLAEPLPKLSQKCTSTVSHSFSSMFASEELYKPVTGEEDDASRIKFLFDCPDISELLSSAEIVNEKPISHMIDSFVYFEDFTGTRALQIIYDAFNKFNCVDYKYCEVTDSFVMMFYNSHDSDGIAREEWRCHLPTPLCLQDFFDYVLEEHYDWFKGEEKIYDVNILSRCQSQHKDLKDPMASKPCVNENELEIELLMEGSLKYKEVANLDAMLSPQNSEHKYFSPKKTSSPVFVTDSKTNKRSKPSANTTPKLTIPLTEKKNQLPKKPFSGYDLGDRRVGIFGKDCSYFSKDGTQISSKYFLLIPMNLEYVTLNIIPGNSGNEFWLHKAVGEFVKPEVLDTCESFRIKSKDEVIMYIKKQMYQIPIPIAHILNKESSIKLTSHDESFKLLQTFESLSFHSLFVTWPNGHITENVYEKGSATCSHIKQYFISPPSNFDEEMRCVSLNGEVIIFKNNGNINVLLPDSSYITISKCRNEIVSNEALQDLSSAAGSDKVKEKGKIKDKLDKSSSKSSKNDFDYNKKEAYPTQYELIIDKYEIIDANGVKKKWINNNYLNIEKLLIKTATDYCLGEVFSKRMDGTTVLLNKDGVQIVTFPNKTRIISQCIIEDEEIFLEWTEEEIEYISLFAYNKDVDVLKSIRSRSQKSFLSSNNNTETGPDFGKVKSGEIGNEEHKTDGYVSIYIIYTIEHPYFTTITIDKFKETVAVASPNNTCITFNEDNRYEFSLDDRVSATFDGENLNIQYDACSQCKLYTTCDVKIKSNDINSVTQMERNWLRMRDSHCKEITVNGEGNINVTNDTFSPQIINNNESTSEELNCTTQNQNENNAECSHTSHCKCKKTYDAKSLKFFILERDLTCSELVHRDIIEQYTQTIRRQPWCRINQYDTLGDHRTLLSILNPVHLNESEKWLMDSKLSNKPTHLTYSYKDLKNDADKGFYHWMRPYKIYKQKPIKPDNVISKRLPRAYILRTLEQQWRDAQRDDLKGAKELLCAILRYRNLIKSHVDTIVHVPTNDLRSEGERRTEEIVQAVADKVYEDLKYRLLEDVQTRAKPDITTRPNPTPEEYFVDEGDEESETRDDVRLIEEGQTKAKEIESALPLSPNLQRYWQRRAEELKEEQFYKCLLREGNVPPYFQNVIGGAIWWENDNTTDVTITKADKT